MVEIGKNHAVPVARKALGKPTFVKIAVRGNVAEKKGNFISKDI